MNGKTLFSVLLPATRKYYDFWVPSNMCMLDVGKLISKAMQTIESDFFIDTQRTALMYIRTGQIQDPYATPAEIGFVDGDCFMLM